MIGFSESKSKRVLVEYKPEAQQFVPNYSVFSDHVEQGELKCSIHVKD
jgi:hypothetical protein